MQRDPQLRIVRGFQRCLPSQCRLRQLRPAFDNRDPRAPRRSSCRRTSGRVSRGMCQRQLSAWSVGETEPITFSSIKSPSASPATSFSDAIDSVECRSFVDGTIQAVRPDRFAGRKSQEFRQSRGTASRVSPSPDCRHRPIEQHERVPRPRLIALRKQLGIHLERLHALVGIEPRHQCFEVANRKDLDRRVEPGFLEVGIEQLGDCLGLDGIVQRHIELRVRMQPGHERAVIGQPSAPTGHD